MVALIYLAVGCGILGLVITYLLLFAIKHFNIDISRNWWVVAIPVVLAIIINVCLIELFRKYKKRRR